MTMCDGRDDDLGSGRGIQNTVTIDTDRHGASPSERENESAIYWQASRL